MEQGLTNRATNKNRAWKKNDGHTVTIYDWVYNTDQWRKNEIFKINCSGTIDYMCGGKNPFPDIQINQFLMN